MHIKKSLLSLVLSAAYALSSSAQTATVIASTNYIPTFGGSLHVWGYGFMAFDYVNVFLDVNRYPQFSCYTDANGSFDMDMTYNGPYRIPNILYRFSNSSDSDPSFTVHYQAGEVAWHADVLPQVEFEAPETIGTNVVPWIKVTAMVARGGNTYQFLAATNLTGPWTPVGRTWVNTTWSTTAFASDFPAPLGDRSYFKVTDPTTYK